MMSRTDGRADAFVTDVLPPLAFGVLLRALRLRSGLSVPRLAELSAVSRAHVEHLEVGWAQLRRRHLTVRPSRETVAALAAGLGLGGVDTARLLIAAGYWPWRMPDAFVVAFVEAVEAASAVPLRDAATMDAVETRG
jgi:hypothetical protein